VLGASGRVHTATCLFPPVGDELELGYVLMFAVQLKMEKFLTLEELEHSLPNGLHDAPLGCNRGQLREA
jgi:hypothetical protein